MARDCALHLRRVERRCNDILVTGATAQMPRQDQPDLLFGGSFDVPQQLDKRHENARRTEAALQAVTAPECFLKRMHRGIAVVTGGKTFDRIDPAPVRLDRKHQATSGAHAVDEHRAGAANAVLASEMGAGKGQVVAQEIRK